MHAGIVPYDLLKSPDDPSQPLIIADRQAGSLDLGAGNGSTGENGETDWSAYADDDSDAPSQDPSSQGDDQGEKSDPWAELENEFSGSNTDTEAPALQEEEESTDSHGHGRPVSLGRPTGGSPSPDAHGHGHSPAMDMSSFIDNDADVPVRRETFPVAHRAVDMNKHRNRSKHRSSPRTDEQRLHTELAILTSLPQNLAPYTLTEMRSLYTHGKKRGKITKSSKKGEHWGKVWGAQMGRCRGEGSEFRAEDGEGVGERRDEDVEGDAEDGEVGAEGKGKGKGLRCSPFTVIYGHAGMFPNSSACLNYIADQPKVVQTIGKWCRRHNPRAGSTHMFTRLIK